MLSVILRGAIFKSIAGFNAMMSVTFFISLTGLIMSKMNRAYGTMNKSKFVSFFALIMSAMIVQAAGVATVIAGEYKAKYGRNSSEIFYYIPLFCSVVSQILVLVASIILLTFTASREYKNCPKLALTSKLLMGIAGIIATLCAGSRQFLLKEGYLDTFFALYYVQMTCVSLISLGIVLGVVFAIIENRRNESNLPVSQSFIAPVTTPPQPVAGHVVYPSAPAETL